mmetsp:Transcript_40703/g.117792  ORF Transcript_40703/g.117792 Transcript_40703/m.117792 type:complete len:237 (-) Transcript_40703:71-781(-)
MPLAAFAASGRVFRERLCASDVRRLRIAQAIWQSSMVVPPALYYLKTSDPTPLFPATISWTIREGVPRLAHHSLWLAAWCLCLSVVQRRGDWRGRAFSWQMLATGVVCVILCPLGSDGLRERIHTWTAAAYMMDHHLFLRAFGVPSHWVAVFWGCFGAFAGGTLASKALVASVEARDAPGPQGKADEHGPYLLREAAQHPSIRERLWRLELFRMFSENGMFFIFLSTFLCRVTGRR